MEQEVLEKPITSASREGIAGLYNKLPSPVRKLCKTIIPAGLRRTLQDMLPYEQDLGRAARFWANPARRRQSLAELEACRTAADYFFFASKHLGHQQIKPEFIGLLEFVNTINPVRICEVGTFLGGTSLMFTRFLSSARLYIGVDMHVRNRTQLRYFSPSSCRPVFVEGLSCDQQTLRDVEGKLGGEKLDFLLIDADHSYEGVKQDFLHYRHFVREGGIIAFHDIIQDQLTKFGYDPATWEGAGSGEVHLFWKNLKNYYEKTREFVADYEQDGCGIGALEYSAGVMLPDNL